MKKLISSFGLAYLVIPSFIFLMNCGGGDPDPGSTPEQTPAQVALAALAVSPWSVKNVTVDAVAKNDIYAGIKLTFNAAGSYTATSGGPIFPGGTIIMSADGKSFTMPDNTVVNIESINTTELVLSLSWSKTTINGGRSESIAGKHVFTFGK